MPAGAAPVAVNGDDDNDGASNPNSTTITTIGNRRRFPCKARNMPPSHREGSAFIEVPENATHGLLLACSHPACSGNGAKKRFCYCVVCKIPVSKRNFMNRHAHGLVEKTNIMLARGRQQQQQQEQEQERQQHATLTGSSSNCSIGSDFVDSGSGVLSSLEDSNEETLRGPMEAAMALQHAITKSSSSSPSSALFCQPIKPPARTVPGPKLQPNELLWLSLLHNRPKDPQDKEAMSTWMNKLLEIGASAAATKRRKTLQSNDDSSQLGNMRPWGILPRNASFPPTRTKLWQHSSLLPMNKEQVPHHHRQIHGREFNSPLENDGDSIETLLFAELFEGV